MKKYLKGSDVEKDKTREKSRLLGVAHEAYVQHCEDMGTDYRQGTFATFYGARLKKAGTDYYLEYENVDEDYQKLIPLHKAKTKTEEELIDVIFDE